MCNKKEYNLTSEEGQHLCEDTKAFVEYGMSKFPEVDEANARFKNSRFHKWVLDRNAKESAPPKPDN